MKAHMNVLSSMIVSGVMVAVPAVSIAADTENPTGPYVGGSVGQFNLELDNLDDVDDAAATIRDSDDNAWKVFAGYRFLPYLGIEAAYIDFGNPGDRFDSSGTDGNYDVNVSGFAPSLIATVPLGPVELFAKVGQYYYDVDTHIDLDSPGPDIDTSYSRNDFLWGGGVSLVVIERLELRAEYEKVEIEDARDSNAFWLGAAWRF
jgi:OOP family OmpA-OmpF porin